jgi:hypothetical protein
MKIKLGELRDMCTGITELLKSGIPARLYFKFKKLLNKLIGELQAFEETRLELCKKYCEKENGKPVMVNGNFQIEDTEKFTEEFMELANTETEIEFEPVPIGEVGDVPITLATERFFKE